jgi:hypothetical protein
MIVLALLALPLCLLLSGYGTEADNSRVPSRGAMGGWDQMRSRLIGDNEGRPMVTHSPVGTDALCDVKQYDL